jgi:hypothetical protein
MVGEVNTCRSVVWDDWIRLLVHPRWRRHVEGDATANFVTSPIQGTGVRYSGTYRELAIGNSLIINNEDIPHPSASRTCRPPAPTATAPRSASASAAISCSTSAPARSATPSSATAAPSGGCGFEGHA